MPLRHIYILGANRKSAPLARYVADAFIYAGMALQISQGSGDFE
jgi:hypothetical protein